MNNIDNAKNALIPYVIEKTPNGERFMTYIQDY